MRSADIIREAFIDRRKLNPDFSMRSFAKDLNLSAGFLSQVLSQQRRLSRDKAATIAKSLNLDSKKNKLFLTLVDLENAKSVPLRESLLSQLKQFEKTSEPFFDLQVDLFRAISEWYHPAILELTESKGFDSKVNTIAERLGISVIEAESAIERLIRIGLLKRDGKILRKPYRNYATPAAPSDAVRAFQSQLLTKAKEQLVEKTYNSRDISSSVMCIDPKKLPEAKKRISSFRRKLMEFLEDGERTKVYSLGVQLICLEEERI